MFTHITEASQVIPHPTERPLFLDIKHPSFIMDSNAPRPSQVFWGFKLHKVHLVKEDTHTTQVAIPCLEGGNTHHMITYQKSQIIPEFHMSGTIEAPLAVPDEKHWNILNNPVFPACLAGFKDRHETSKGGYQPGRTKYGRYDTNDNSPLCNRLQLSECTYLRCEQGQAAGT